MAEASLLPRSEMGSSVLDIPPEILQKVARYAITFSPLGPPKELYGLLLTCRTFHGHLSIRSAGDLYSFILSEKFDARAPVYRLGQEQVRDNALPELQRRFMAIQTFKRRDIYDASLTEAFWIAYIMIEDSDTRQKNVKQLLRVGLPTFLDLFIRRRLYEGSETNDGWPLLSERNSLAIALSWSLASHSSVSREDPGLCEEMLELLRPFVFAAFRYSIFHSPEDIFLLDGMHQPSVPTLKTHHGIFPPLALAPREIAYFGKVKRKTRIPSAAIFASLLYFTRLESRTFKIPPEIACQTRAEAIAAGQVGPCIDDVQHFLQNCRTRFAVFPAIDVGIKPSIMSTSPDTVLYQPSLYKLGTFSGRWQGSMIIPGYGEYTEWLAGNKPHVAFEDAVRTPVFLTLKEHYCYEPNSVIPTDSVENGMKNAWLPADLQVSPTHDGVRITNATNTFSTNYDTFRDGQGASRERRKIVDVIITGKTDDEFTSVWGLGPSVTILGRVRLEDGLVVLRKMSAWGIGEQVMRGYMTSSQNLVGRVKGVHAGSLVSPWEGIFSLCKNHAASTPAEPESAM